MSLSTGNLRCYYTPCKKRAKKSLEFWCSEKHKKEWQKKTYPKPIDEILRIQTRVMEIIAEKRKKRQERYPFGFREDIW